MVVWNTIKKKNKQTNKQKQKQNKKKKNKTKQKTKIKQKFFGFSNFLWSKTKTDIMLNE